MRTSLCGEGQWLRGHTGAATPAAAVLRPVADVHALLNDALESRPVSLVAVSALCQLIQTSAAPRTPDESVAARVFVFGVA